MQPPLQTSEKSTNKKAKLFFLTGLMGSGKTYWGQVLAAKNNFNFIDLDAIIENSIDISISQIFDTKGEFFFRKIETEVLTKISTKHNTIIATGGGTPCFNNNMSWMNENGITIWLNQSIENIIEKIIPEKIQRPLIADISNQDLSAFFANQLQQRKFFYQQSNHNLNANEISENNLQKIIDLYA